MKKILVFLVLLGLPFMTGARPDPVKSWTMASCYSKFDSVAFSAPYTTPSFTVSEVVYSVQVTAAGTTAGDKLDVVFVLPAGDSVKITHSLAGVYEVTNRVPLQITKYRAQFTKTGGASEEVAVQICAFGR